MPTDDADNSAGAAAVRHEGLADAPAPSEDEGQQWLGCEGLHPLTWLPPPTTGAADGD